MAETASIISPDKKVLIPDPEAGCSLAETINLEQLKKWKSEHPDALVVSYVNTSAAVKSETDYCVTSSNAVKIVESIPKDKEILFLPDMFLGAFVSKVTGRKIHIWARGMPRARGNTAEGHKKDKRVLSQRGDDSSPRVRLHHVLSSFRSRGRRACKGDKVFLYGKDD